MRVFVSKRPGWAADAAEEAERRGELHPVGHDAAAGSGLKLVDVAEGLEWSADLFVREAAGECELCDAAGHGEWKSKVPRPPRHVLALADKPGGHTADRTLSAVLLRVQ